MAGLFLVQTAAPHFADAALAGARAQFALHGFRMAGVERQLPGWRLLHLPYIVGGPENLLAQGDDLVAIAGTLTFDGLMGETALRKLLESAALPALDWSRIGGHFVAFVRKGGRNFLFTDYFAAFQIFHDQGRTVFSTSLLAAARALPRLSFDSQGVYEFAFNVVPTGDDTVFAELKTLGPREIIELTERGCVVHATTKPLPGLLRDMPPEERLRDNRERLEKVVAAHVSHFGDRVHCPLSGGLDSRLLLAALRAAGSRPEVYVYGPPGSPDVEIAQAIGTAQGFPVRWMDKHAADLDPAAFVEQVERNFHEFDGLPNFGNIFDNGGNAIARDARHAGGGLAVSGGCGEIYRDFFFLPDRPITAATVASTSFARFIRRDTTALFDPTRFLRRISDKIRDALEMPGETGPIPRAQVEQIYPRVRCRSLFGREISMEARYGAYLMPFLDHQVVAGAMALPMRLKQAGRFEAQLLAAIDPELARQPSAYGHDFAGPPSRAHRMSEWSSRIRPAWVRRESYGIRRRLRPMSDEHGGLLGPAYMNRVLDPAFPAMRRFFRMDQITDSGLWRRIACLEYLAHHLGSYLVDEAGSTRKLPARPDRLDPVGEIIVANDDPVAGPVADKGRVPAETGREPGDIMLHDQSG